MSIFSKNLRYLRKRENRNQDEIAILFKKRANTIGNWENEKSEPSLGELMKLGEFFNVSTQDLLHTDMESDSSFIITSPLYKVSEKSNPGQLSPSGSSVKEASPDAFWLILRELRAIGEKLDALASGTETGMFKKNSDKSYH